MSDAIVEFLSSLDWLKFGGFAAVPLALAIAYPLAKHKFNNDLKANDEAINNLRESLQLKQAQITADAVKIAQLTTGDHAKQGMLDQLTAQHKQLADKHEQVLSSGQKLYRECLQLRPLIAKLREAEAVSLDLSSRLADAKARNDKLEHEVNVTNKDLLQAGKRFLSAERRFKRAMETEGQFWNTTAYKSRPKFLPLLQRKCAVVSLLNLKGGVGKTTTSAHLAAAFAQRGYRVLMVDLDLQGSLTSLLVPGAVRDERFDQKLMLKDFLQHTLTRHKKPKGGPEALPLPGMGQGATPAKPNSLAAYAVRVIDNLLGGGSVDVVPTTDTLALAELSLNINWLLRSGERDARFLLRKALHGRHVVRDYDLVILDCPPLLNISCINALAASDYVIIPALPSIKSLERVPKLLETLTSASFKENINHDLHIMGLLANRTLPAGLSIDQGNQWSQQLNSIANNQNFKLRRVETFIPQTKEVQEAEQTFALPALDSTLGEVCSKLVLELEGILPHDCRRTAKLPV